MLNLFQHLIESEIKSHCQIYCGDLVNKSKHKKLAPIVASSCCGVPKFRDATTDTANSGTNSEWK
jgi:hypothetical protein